MWEWAPPDIFWKMHFTKFFRQDLWPANWKSFIRHLFCPGFFSPSLFTLKSHWNCVISFLSHIEHLKQPRCRTSHSTVIFKFPSNSRFTWSYRDGNVSWWGRPQAQHAAVKISPRCPVMFLFLFFLLSTTFIVLPRPDLGSRFMADFLHDY